MELVPDSGLVPGGQQVKPEPKPNSCGRDPHWLPVCSTNRIPHRACRSGTRGRPSTSFGDSSVNNGSIIDHSSSEMIQGRDCLFRTTRQTNGETSQQSYETPPSRCPVVEMSIAIRSLDRSGGGVGSEPLLPGLGNAESQDQPLVVPWLVTDECVHVIRLLLD